MLKHYTNINEIKGFVDFRDKTDFYNNKLNKIIIYKYHMQGLTGICLQSSNISVEDNGTYWIVRKG